MLIQEIPKTDKSIMRALIMEVFGQFVAPDYSAKGVASFRDFVMNDDMLTGYICYGAYEGNLLQGILVADDVQGHIVLYFVKAEAQGRGIGRALWEHLLAHSVCPAYTVNASLYAALIYERLGFAVMGDEQETDGIRYIPMKFER